MFQKLRVAMIGYGFMGKVHSNAWRNVNRFFPDAPQIEMAVICGRSKEALENARVTFGWNEAVTDWQSAISRKDIDIVDICTAGDTHEEIAIAALRAGKHVICEKPLANNVSEATAMAEAARDASKKSVKSMVAFNYRRVPALAVAKQFIDSGKLGTLYHVRANYLQDWIIDPEFPLVWRLDKKVAGSGALGDIAAHIIDASYFLTSSKITSVSGQLKTFIKERPLPGTYTGLTAGASLGRGTVTVDDTAVFTANFENGAIGTFEATRFAAGRKNAMSIEVNGSKGSIYFNFEDMNELLYHDHTDPSAEAGFRKILTTDGAQPYIAAWWPPGHIIGYEHTFTHEIYDFLLAIKNGSNPSPSFDDGLYVQRVLDAVAVSAGNNSLLTQVK
ncbi:MAG: gfo/Idh/MocA family oxidoreductase [Actinobacteria bacterium]|nr:gfo/Idh/MocA family oxidoreductase [Actinomycetota bacterium]NBO07097.1 gfo/Idh/MocA family oxidoreductase [Actinomycetota bacterium]NBO47159.1 gfo/Idh/MocA family oxidoreductase [Actinomycetota bacterium]NBP11882.1 gfo/Idh/MocA family oxidoreductase [Actinomycetota bacterium]NBP21991.1 gfo/Idh/MocA family oxidoreductase [Actinomycetota bacterium]